MGWSNTKFTSLPITNTLPIGPALLTMFTNGIPVNLLLFVWILDAPNGVTGLSLSVNHLNFDRTTLHQTITLSSHGVDTYWASKINHGLIKPLGGYTWM